jgi:plasmid stability protein
MRTTVDIPDAMHRRLKARAAGEGKSAKALILRSIEQLLAGQAGATKGKLVAPVIRSKRQGSLRIDNAGIYDVLSFP